MNLKIILPIELPTPNRFMRMSMGQLTRMKAEYRMLLRVVYEPKHIADKKVKRKVHIISYRKKLMTDDDNLKFVSKFLMDALKKTGFIYDDDRKYVAHKVTQVVDRENPRTEVMITSPEKLDKASS